MHFLSSDSERISNFWIFLKKTESKPNFGFCTSLVDIFLKIQFWYLRCWGCPWNRGRQHLATPLKTCHNTEAGFLQGGCSAYPPTQRWRHLRLRRSRTWAVCLPLSAQKGDHPPSHDDNFARTSVCRWLPQKPTASQVEAARNPEKGGYFRIYLLLDGLA